MMYASTLVWRQGGKSNIYWKPTQQNIKKHSLRALGHPEQHRQTWTKNEYHYNPDLNSKPEKITAHESSKSKTQRPTHLRRRQLIKKNQESFDLRTTLTNNQQKNHQKTRKYHQKKKNNKSIKRPPTNPTKNRRTLPPTPQKKNTMIQGVVTIGFEPRTNDESVRHEARPHIPK